MLYSYHFDQSDTICILEEFIFFVNDHFINVVPKAMIFELESI
jgi:hypothetical protein